MLLCVCYTQWPGLLPQHWLWCVAGRRVDLDLKGGLQTFWVYIHYFIVNKYLERASWEPGRIQPETQPAEKTHILVGWGWEWGGNRLLKQGNCSALEGMLAAGKQSWGTGEGVKTLSGG